MSEKNDVHQVALAAESTDAGRSSTAAHTQERFVHQPQDFISVSCPEVIYIGIADRTAFDKIAAPVLDHGENERGHVLTKIVGNLSTVAVIFQYWLKSLSTEAMLADARAAKATAQAAS